MVRLIEAAPTWASDRAQGARVLLLAIAAGSLPGSQSQRLTWTWKLARASRETQYRAATAASPAIRDLLRTLASSRGEEHHVRARLLVASLRQAELPVAAAALAAALTHDAIAARTIETARAELGADVEELAAAFASNLPEQKAEPPAKARRHAQEAQGPPGGRGLRRGRRERRDRRRKPAEAAKAPAAAARVRGEPGAGARGRARAASAAVAAVAARARAKEPGGRARRTARPKPQPRPSPGRSDGPGGTRARAGHEGHAAQEARPGPVGRTGGRRPRGRERAEPQAKPKPRPRRRKRAVMDAASIGLPPKGEAG